MAFNVGTMVIISEFFTDLTAVAAVDIKNMFKDIIKIEPQFLG